MLTDIVKHNETLLDTIKRLLARLLPDRREARRGADNDDERKQKALQELRQRLRSAESIESGGLRSPR
jgi:hypothetical protein